MVEESGIGKLQQAGRDHQPELRPSGFKCLGFGGLGLRVLGLGFRSGD